MLEEDVFNVDEKGLSAFKDFQDNDVEDNTVTIIDPNADTEDEIEGSYIGKVILDCRVCHSKIYKEAEEITIDEETESANASEECPFCYSVEGFTIIGEVAEYEGTSENKKQNEPEEKDEEETDEDDDENIEEMFRRVPNKRIKESPTYDLNPRYDKRKSFYGKAKVDTGYNDDENKLYSYGTLVAEIKNGKPVVYGTYSQTTLRHIKDWLKQNGFEAKSSRQIMADYGVKNEAYKKRMNENAWGADELWSQINNNEWAYNTLAKIVKDGIEKGHSKHSIQIKVYQAIEEMKDDFGRIPTTKNERINMARDFMINETSGYSYEYSKQGSKWTKKGTNESFRKPKKNSLTEKQK